MSSTSSRVPGEGSLPTDSLASAQSATSKTKAIAKRSSKRGFKTAALILPQSSGTSGSSFERTTPESTEALRTWLREASLASPSPSLESARGAQTTATFGLSSPKWCGRFDPNACSLRTCQDSLPGMEDATSERSSVTWPRSGTVSGGVCWELTLSVPRTGARGSGYWRTPNVMDSLTFKTNEALAHEYTHREGRSEPNNLRDQLAVRMGLRMWLTPSVEDAGRQGKAENWRQYEEGGRTTQARLRNQVMWPTPQAEDSHHGGRSMSPRGVQKRLTEGRQLDLGQTVALRGGPLTRQTYPTPRTITGGAESAQRKQELGRTKSGGGDLQSVVQQKCNLHSDEWYQKAMGQLNPEWVEWLMGWPIGWTALEPLATDRFQRWLRLHGGC